VPARWSRKQLPPSPPPISESSRVVAVDKAGFRGGGGVGPSCSSDSRHLNV
jgi:hypothetical protein